jgi:hypothetical protein
MRCYFLRGGHIVAVEELTGLSDKEVIVKAQVLFSESEVPVGAFEVGSDARDSQASAHRSRARMGRRWTSGNGRRSAMAYGFDAEPMTMQQQVLTLPCAGGGNERAAPAGRG